MEPNMTRETRIGLLVGLLFIIMFGLVLSELAGTSTPASVEGQDLVSSGGIEDVITRYSDLPTPPPARTDPPARPVLALAPAPGGRSIPASAPVAPPAAPVDAPPPISPRDMLAAIGDDAAPIRSVPVVLPPRGAGTTPAPGLADAPPPPAPPAQRTYTVQPGDTLTRIARKVYGPGNENEYKRILEANKKTVKDETRLQVNQVLTIPPLPASPGSPPSPPPVRPARAPTMVADLNTLPAVLDSAPPRPIRVQGPSPAPADQPRHTYVIRQGDTLTRIAREVLKDASRAGIQRLIDANKSKISDPRKIQPGMELEIPS